MIHLAKILKTLQCFHDDRPNNIREFAEARVQIVYDDFCIFFDKGVDVETAKGNI